MGKEKKLKIIQITFISLCIVIISILGILTLMNNDTLSVKEGRTLVTFPDITLESLAKDEFYTNYTDAFADQLAFREDLIKWYYLFNLQRYVGDVIRGKNNQLFLSPLIIENETKYEKNLKNVAKNNITNVAESVKAAGAKFIFLSIPRKDVVMDKYLPDTYIKGIDNYLKYVNILKENVSNNVEVVDAYEIFKAGDTYDVFYTTDHHINIRGAYAIFENIINRVNNDGYNLTVNKLEDEYEIKEVVINGSYNRKIGQSVVSNPEELTLIPKNTNVEYTRKDNGSVTNKPVFNEGNDYATSYMGDDYAETVITTNNEDAPNIMYVGSSYTNILEALSVYKFNTVVSVDYRHNTTGKTIAEYVEEYDIDYVIYICSQQTNALGISSIKEHLGPTK